MLRPLLARVYRWFDRHPFAGDHLVAAFTVLLVPAELISGRLFSYDTPVAPTTEEVLVSLALVAPLPFGPRMPVAVFATVMATCLVQLAVTEHVLVADLAPLVALYYLVVHGPSRVKPIGLGVAVVGGVVMSARASFPGVLDGFVLGTAVITAEVLLAALLADRRLSRRARLAALEVERDQQAEIGAAHERARIARELHDVLAHSISLINVQASSALHLLDSKPEHARPALEAIKRASGEALTEVRGVLETLRRPDDGTTTKAPAPTLARIDDLTAEAQAAGLDIETVVEGSPRSLPATVELAAYRICQEAVTNVIRHAGPASARLKLDYREHELVVEVSDDGRGANGTSGGGNGLPGMQERATALGGSLQAGPHPDGGFRVRARLPVP
jgi:signal transduction histidine kinase